MNKHTPGPWKIATDWAGYPQHIRTECGSVACSFLTSVKRNCGIEQIEANARLIAAAPDLLEALLDCIFVIERDLNGLPIMQPELRQARAAIVKATGGQP
jgi:hypothetical protein